MYEYKLINLDNIIGREYETIKEYFQYNGISRFDENDIEELKTIAEKMEDRKGFNVSYIIERLDKEFDLIKVGNKRVLNIELKLTEKDVEQCEDNYKILNKYYNGYDISVFCYEKEKNKVYKYNSGFRVLEDSNFNELNKAIKEITAPVLFNIDINVTSVYKNPENFIEKNYRLSQAQKNTKEKIKSTDDKIIIVTGRAGTGKSLLALDLYSFYNENNNCIFLCPFKINSLVSTKLRKAININTVRNFCSKPSEYDVIIIDEAQRISRELCNIVIKYANKKLILLGDINQRVDYEHHFKDLYENKEYVTYNMMPTIRSDDTFDMFARKVLNISSKGIKSKKIDKSKIKIYMKDEKLPDLSEHVFIEPGKSKFSNCKDNCKNMLCNEIFNQCIKYETTYDIISQEYPKVAMSMCHEYYIDEENNLCAKSGVCYSYLNNHLYTIITRAIEELVIIVDNIELYNYLIKCLEQLKK